MRLTPFARRSAAVAATAALISSGGALVAAPAWAVPAPATVDDVRPSSWDNRSAVTVTLTGSNFALGDSVVLQPACSDDTSLPVTPPATCAPLTGAEVGDLSFSASTTPLTGTETAKLDLSMAPPGRYRVVVEHADTTTSAPWSVSGVVQYFQVFAYGSANASGTTVGLGASAVDPLGIDCTTEVNGTGCGRAGALPLDVSGSNVAIGAKVQFLKASDHTVDTGLPFTPGNPSNGQNVQSTSDNTGYPSAGLIQGSYDATLNQDQTAAFTPGWHDVRVVNTDGRTSGSTSRFAQPYFAPSGSLSLPTSLDDPNPTVTTTIGQGAKGQLLRITGQGIRAGSKLFVENKKTNSCADVSVGSSTLGGVQADSLYSWIEAPVSFAQCTSPDNSARRVGIVGPDGGRFYRSAFLQIGPAPVFSSFSDASYKVLGQGAHVGFDGIATDGVLVNGSGFVGSGQTDVTKMTHFDFGPGVTATTRQVNPTGASAFVSIDVDPGTGTGERTVTAINPDGGSTTSDCVRIQGQCDPTGDGPLFTVTEGPKITQVAVANDSATPAMTPGQQSPTKFSVTGSGFQANGYSNAQLVVALPGQTTQDPNITVQAIQRVSATNVTFQASAGANAVRGARDLIVVNDDRGRVVCSACLGIDSVAVSPNNAANTGVTSPAIGLTVLFGGLPALSSSSTVTLTHRTPLYGQPDIHGTSVTSTNVDGKHGSAVFDLTHAALGQYNVTVVLDPTNASASTVSCIGCFTVTGAAAALDGTTPVSPAQAGQGVTDWKITFKGTGFTKGMDVSIPDVTVHDVTFVDPTQITALVDVASTAATGAKTGTLTAGDGTTKTFSFTVNPAPTLTSGSVAPASYGAGAGSAGAPTPAPTLTVGGTGFDTDPDAQITLGGDATVSGEAVTAGSPPTGICPLCVPGTDDSDTGTLALSQTAALGKRAVTVTNPADGGSVTLADAFTVAPGPKVASVTNKDGFSVLCAPPATGCTNPQSITVLGSDFPSPSTDPDKAQAFRLLEPNGDAAAGIALSNVVFAAGKITADVTVDSGRALGPLKVAVYDKTTSGFFTCDTCLAVAMPPSEPGNVVVTSLAKALKVTWAGSTPNGSPVSSYVLSLIRSGSTAFATAGSCAVNGTGVKYDLLASVDGLARTYTFTGLVNGGSYTVSICALNGAGQSPVVVKTGVAGLPASLSLAVSTTKALYGQKVVLTGKLLGTNGVALGGRTIVLAITPAVGGAYTRTVQTVSTGGYAYGLVSAYNVKVRALWAGDTTTYRSAASVYRAFTVAARVLITSPANGSKSSATNTLKIAGTVSPTKKGSAIYLYRVVNGKLYGYAKTYVTSTGTYTFAIKPPKGTWTFRVFLPATVGNAAGLSAARTFYRV